MDRISYIVAGNIVFQFYRLDSESTHLWKDPYVFIVLSILSIRFDSLSG